MPRDARALDATSDDATHRDGAIDDAPFEIEWHDVDSLAQARYGHTATRMRDGTVIVAGGEAWGSARIIDAVERFDPRTERWTTVATTPAPLRNHTATLLPSGDVLFVGGGPSSPSGHPSGQVVTDAWILRAADWSFEATGALAHARSHHVAVTLTDGRVLVAGGAGETISAGRTLPDALSSCEIYDPSSGAFSPTGAMSVARFYHAASAIGDDVLVVGGVDEHETSFASAERYEAAGGGWAQVGSLRSQDRMRHAIATLDTGRVLIAAGKRSNIAFLSSAEAFDGRGWTRVGDLVRGGNGGRMAPIAGGRALFVGGYGVFSATSDYVYRDAAQLFDERTGEWTQLSSMTRGRTLHTLTPLEDGSLLVVGGLGRGGEASATSERAIRS